MEQEEFGFSVLQPILFTMSTPALYYLFLEEKWFFILTHNVLIMIFSMPFVLYIWKQLRITVLMLLQKPAVVLTEEAVIITERNYTIYWEDVMDVYLSNDGSPAGGVTAPKNRYIIIRVREPEKYIKSIKNPFTRYYRWYTRRLWNLSPFEINLFLVRGDDDEIYHQVLKYFQNNRLYFKIPHEP